MNSTSQPNAATLLSVRDGLPGRIDRLIVYLASIPWHYYLLIAYGFLIPVVAMNLPGVGGVGAADLLMPFGFFVLFFLRPIGRIQLPHVALTCFIFAALVSLLQIEEFKPAVDCTIRWVRLLGIFIPFYFSLFIPVDDKLIHTSIKAWIAGGLTAILIGIALHVFQIEVRQGQQRLWMNGASMLRAGGLIGNSGAFGHMTSTWAVISLTYLLSQCKGKLRFALAGCVVFFTFYVIIISSSRAAMLHLLSAGGVFAVMFPTPKVFRQWFVLGMVYGILGIVMLSCAMECRQKSESGPQSGFVETNLQRFIPGYGGTSAGEFTSNRAGIVIQNV